jgi:hypothetical protein
VALQEATEQAEKQPFDGADTPNAFLSALPS